MSISFGTIKIDKIRYDKFQSICFRKSFRFIEDEIEPDLLTVHNVNEWLSSLRLVPTSSTTVDVDISEEGFKEFDQYKVEYTTIDQLDQWQQV